MAPLPPQQPFGFPEELPDSVLEDFHSFLGEQTRADCALHRSDTRYAVVELIKGTLRLHGRRKNIALIQEAGGDPAGRRKGRLHNLTGQGAWEDALQEDVLAQTMRGDRIEALGLDLVECPRSEVVAVHVLGRRTSQMLDLIQVPHTEAGDFAMRQRKAVIHAIVRACTLLWGAGVLEPEATPPVLSRHKGFGGNWELRTALWCRVPFAFELSPHYRTSYIVPPSEWVGNALVPKLGSYRSSATVGMAFEHFLPERDPRSAHALMIREVRTATSERRGAEHVVECRSERHPAYFIARDRLLRPPHIATVQLRDRAIDLAEMAMMLPREPLASGYGIPLFEHAHPSSFRRYFLLLAALQAFLGGQAPDLVRA